MPFQTNQDLIRNRLKQVFKYLKALNEYRNPPVRQVREQTWVMPLIDLPDDPSIQLSHRQTGVSINESEDSAADGSDVVLRVRRPSLTECPKPLPSFKEWLVSGWEDPNSAVVKVVASRNTIDESGETIVVLFSDDADRVEALSQWKEQRTLWRTGEIPSRQAFRVYERLYELYGIIERESEKVDLVIGDGVLSWHRTDGGVFHPVLLQRVQLDFNPAKPEFTIIDTANETEFYSSLFNTFADVDASVIAACRKELEEQSLHPLMKEASGFLKRLVVVLSSKGDLIEDAEPQPESEFPVIGRSPYLFLRRRGLGFTIAIDRLLESIDRQNEFCAGLVRIIGVDEAEMGDSNSNSLTESRSDSSDMLPAEILLGKPANEQQKQIAERLAHTGAVLVQGPPGTGKSHTIANLLGHLLAQNKSVLVTSHTTKALAVLRGHVVEQLRPLCVSVLDRDSESQRQLREAVQGISERLGTSNAEDLTREAERLAVFRRKLIHELEGLKQKRHQVVSAEYEEIVVGGRSSSPSDAARFVRDGSAQHSWIPGPVVTHLSLPITPEEVAELYQTNGQTTDQDVVNAHSPLPLPELLPTSELFRSTVQEVAEFRDDSADLQKSLWIVKTFSRQTISDLDNLIQNIHEISAEWSRFEPWMYAVVDSGRMGTAQVAPWQRLISVIEKTLQVVSDSRMALLEHTVALSAQPHDVQEQIASEIRMHLEAGKKIGFFSPRSWKDHVKLWRVSGVTPSKAAHFDAIAHAARVQVARHLLCQVWNKLLTPHNGPDALTFGDEPEQMCGQFCESIQKALNWWSFRVATLVQRTMALGFQWDAFLVQQPPMMETFGPARRILTAIEFPLQQQLMALKGKFQSQLAEKLFKDLTETLSSFERPEVIALKSSVAARDGDAYEIAYDALNKAAARQEIAVRRRNLLARIDRNPVTQKSIAPAWAMAIRNRGGVHGGVTVPGPPLKAWEWQQLSAELERRQQLDLPGLSEKIEELQERLKQTTNELIDCRAWAAQVKRISLSQRQALMGWLAINIRIGARKGKRTASLERQAREQLRECRPAVPVWIMPLHRLAESFDFSEQIFDVVIIDEASQCDVMGLMALVLAKSVVVVGDNEQVSPLAVGQDVLGVEQLIRGHLQGIPNSMLYDGKMSIYDLAAQSFGSTICLLEHFRCMPDIIQFSNRLSYHGRIRPLRDPASSHLTPAVVPFRVPDGLRERDINRNEALVIASLICAASKIPEYNGQTFGVISMIGDTQAKEIEKILRLRLNAEVFVERCVRCGNSADFQGDERDVMFLSLVESPKSDDGFHTRYDRDDARKRYNVAASRARNQMWVVYSLNKEQLRPNDLRKKLIEHALAPNAIETVISETQAKADSVFEQEVIRHLLLKGFKVTPQWKVGGYRIDIVVEGNGKRLAVECDGDRFHPIEKIPEDMERQAVLERLGWTFHRIRGSEFFRDPDSAMEDLDARLKRLGIEPELVASNLPSEVTKTETNAAILIRAAEQLREEWLLEDSDVEGVLSEEESLAENRHVSLAQLSQTVVSAEVALSQVLPVHESAMTNPDDQPNENGDLLVSAIQRAALEIQTAGQERTKTESADAGRCALLPGKPEDFGDSGNTGARAKQTVKRPADSGPATQATLFPTEDEEPIPPEQKSVADPCPDVTVPSGPVTHDVEPREEPVGKGNALIDAEAIDRLLDFLDKAIFPAVAGSERRGSRLTRIENWRSALATCDGTPEDLYAALSGCDPAITKGRDRSKVVAAIRSWYAESRH